MTLASFLDEVVQSLEDAGIPYMLTGSLAAASYATARATQDVDLVIDAPLLRINRLVDRFLTKGFYVSREAAQEAFHGRGQFNVIEPRGGWKVDLIFRKDRPFSVEEFSRRRHARLFDTEVSIVSREDLILAKLEWSTVLEKANLN